MSTLSGASSLHRDVRSEYRSYKRDKEHTAKWALGGRPSAGGKINYNYDWEPFIGAEGQQAKVRPNKSSWVTLPDLILPNFCDSMLMKLIDTRQINPKETLSAAGPLAMPRAASLASKML
jgi:hypothetical protein